MSTASTTRPGRRRRRQQEQDGGQVVHHVGQDSRHCCDGEERPQRDLAGHQPGDDGAKPVEGHRLYHERRGISRRRGTGRRGPGRGRGPWPPTRQGRHREGDGPARAAKAGATCRREVTKNPTRVISTTTTAKTGTGGGARIRSRPDRRGRRRKTIAAPPTRLRSRPAKATP